MGDAYTPGLAVTPRTAVRRTRRLPLAGQILVKVGDEVSADTVVARTDLPGKVFPVNVAQKLSILPEEVPAAMRKNEGADVAKGDLLAETHGLFGWFRSEVRSPTAGVVESISRVSGQVLLREPPIPVEVKAYLRGTVVEELPGEGVVIEATGAFVQGIFGLAGEKHAPLRAVARSPDDRVDPDRIPADAAGQILILGGLLPLATLRRCFEVGAAGVVTGGFAYQDIHALLGADIGMAVTGHEPLPTTLLLTEGFGDLPMARATFELLVSHAGEAASMTGATQIRAGVIRPEIIVPHTRAVAAPASRAAGLEVGAAVRCVRAPHFGRIGEVAALPPGLATMPSETKVRVVEVRFGDGEVATVPRANVELIQVS
jgi:hypothetical protein